MLRQIAPHCREGDPQLRRLRTGPIGRLLVSGLKHRPLNAESRVFYAKIEADLNRYKLDILMNREREARANRLENSE